ncbi:Rho GTPase activation protein [Gilbertella persicaria]|uniref:Rho GTPase activation protein n=1 Tax=Gilbertella persicaria TaxID=101096 RepID=UPI0022210821|nr:Rho GTPase activation protein [Gilbertella persicaria]KAI8047108.1 Rho GTPase activation protein [Gilbertella persicaria]
MSGLPMPNFTNVGSSLRKELNEEEEEEDTDHVLSISYYSDMISAVQTPDLIIEEEEEEENESVTDSESQAKFERYWLKQTNQDKLVVCQAIARTWLVKRKVNQEMQLYRSSQNFVFISQVQAQVRGYFVRRELASKRIDYYAYVDFIVHVQQVVRRYLAKHKQERVIDYYKVNIDQVIQVQSLIRHKLMGTAYRKLRTFDNPTVGTVKNFIHLLDDSDLDFDRELALEDLRQQVIESIKENNHLDAHVNTLDIQIALFLKNTVSIEDVLKHNGALKKKKEQQRMLETQTGKANPFSLTGIDKDSRQRLELFQELVYLLQTEPKYLARLLSMTSRQDLGHYASHKLIESTVLSLFGYATNSREEYLLINLCKYCIAEEMKNVESTQEFMRGNYTFMKLVVQTNRGAKEREFFRTLLSPLVTEIVNNDFLDLETDPVSIYHKAINDEECRTGMPSNRPHAVTSQEALADPEVRDTFVIHLRNLREITEQFFMAITSTIDSVPYGIRVVARELRLILEESFPDEPHERIIRIIGNFIYYRYLNPAVVAPEQYDVIDAVINPIQRKNLAEISKMLQHISSGTVFEDAHDIFLAPLNEYVADAALRFGEWFLGLTDVEDPESYFGMHSLTDQTNTHKPIVYLSPNELFHLHYTIQTNIEALEPEGDGILHEIIDEIGASAYHPDIELPESMVCLRLSNRCDSIPLDPTARLQQLLVDTKRLVIYVIKIQSGQNLANIFQVPTTSEHEIAWTQLKAKEFLERAEDRTVISKRRHLQLGQSEPPLDLQSVNFFQLKSIANRLVVHLERCKVIASNNGYQDVINMIARDITGKNSRRMQRDRELARMKLTLSHLKEKRDYLLDQGNSYEGYLDSCMTAMATKRGKKQKFTLPFTRQYFHMRGLQKSGLVPKFGSYKYTAKQLYERNIILELMDIPKKHYDRIPIILSMNQAGIITIEGSYAGWPMSSVQVDMRYEELLQTQFEGVQTVTVLDGMARVNVNLLIYLINKK